MNYRFLLLVAPLLLSGCSTLSQLSWSSLSPFNWFSSTPEVTEKGVGDITASTRMDQDAVSKALNNDYRIRTGMATHNGDIIAFYQAMEDGDVRLVITGKSKGNVEQVDVMDPKIRYGKVRIGTPFSELYQRAFGACQKSSGDYENAVECRAPGSSHVSYLFTGNWRGPAELMPDDVTLRAWTLNKIIWRSAVY
ncbi:RpoE-regulated lipoprotein [Enterobacillus tribolii]|uniref:Uncharacterized protein DUF1131 n=1 Tax=Enterobacillus tribolii TaxID=1487935 RepID=A0A370QRT6_9GAMM|nr:RpoE-regulated lipoprotein [Enterobacillus tribolii]MBW7983534.1 RpoE-regulated lipoprotein [Enterobacillus tribolii]RDK91967.1 uncharacterized protein DUF1131 [Enterobacillus tribolii]